MVTVFCDSKNTLGPTLTKPRNYVSKRNQERQKIREDQPRGFGASSPASPWSGRGRWGDKATVPLERR